MSPKTTSSTRGTKAFYKCGRCQIDFLARVADRKRGWAKFCSKSCKAIKQEANTGQYNQYINDIGCHENPTFSNANQFDNTEL